MTKIQMLTILKPLAAEYEKFDTSPPRMRLWYDCLGHHDARAFACAIEWHLINSKWAPKISDISDAIIRVSVPPDRCPTAIDAWDTVTATNWREADTTQFPPLIRRTVKALGGLSHIQQHDNPSVIRAQFMAAYGEIKKETMLGITTPPKLRDAMTRLQRDFIPTKKEAPQKALMEGNGSK